MTFKRLFTYLVMTLEPIKGRRPNPSPLPHDEFCMKICNKNVAIFDIQMTLNPTFLPQKTSVNELQPTQNPDPSEM